MVNEIQNSRQKMLSRTISSCRYFYNNALKMIVNVPATQLFPSAILSFEEKEIQRSKNRFWGEELNVALFYYFCHLTSLKPDNIKTKQNKKNS